MKIEITEKINYDGAERYKIMLHSFYNIMTVLCVDIALLESASGLGHKLAPSKEIYEKLMRFVSDPQTYSNEINNIEEYVNELKININESAIEIIEKLPEKAEFFNKIIRSLHKVFEIIKVRAREFIYNINHENEWSIHNIGELKEKLEFVFTVIAEKSRSCTDIAFSKQNPDTDEYSIFFNISSADNNQEIFMPPFFQDVLRDLTANARKYSKPGNIIRSTLHNDGEFLLLNVEDSGRGIPESEINNVVQCGYRASNTTKDETYGAGFGLTKAWIMCQNYNGRMWIESAVNQGTKISMMIPVPQV